MKMLCSVLPQFRIDAARMESWSRLTILSAGLMAAALNSPCAAQTSASVKETLGLPSQYSATAIGQGGTASGKSFGLDIYVQDLTDDRQLLQLETILKAEGQDGVVRMFGNIKDKGRISPPGSVGTGARFVRVTPTREGGKHIVLATDRPISLPELYNSTRSTDYKISIVVLDIDKNGKGSGSFAPLCKIRFNRKDQLEVETYGQNPFRLANVYQQK